MTQRGAATVTLEAPTGPGAARVLSATLALAFATRRPVSWHLPEGEPPPEAERFALARSVAGATRSSLDEGAEGSRFTPAVLRPGRFTVNCAPGVPAMLALSTLHWPLALAGGTSEVDVAGDTHVANAPSFHDFALGLVPAAERLGVGAEVALESAGFAPEGGGLVRAKVFAAPRLNPLELTHRGMLREVRALACVANLGIGLALPLERRLSERLRSRGIAAQVEVLPMPAARGRGLGVVVAAEFEHARSVFTAVGEAGRSVDEVVEEAVRGLSRLLERRGAVDAVLAEQLLVPAALAASAFGAPGAIGPSREGRRSRFTVSEVTPELLAIARAARALCEVEVLVQGLPGDEGVLEVRPAA